MSPVMDPQVVAPKSYSLRHIGPKAAIWAAPPVAVTTYAVLNQPALIARPLPSTDATGVTAFVSGQWVGRLNDAGDGQVIFPNDSAPDGIPWRDRFDSAGRNQWIEIYDNKELEQVFCIVQVNRQANQIEVSGGDGFWVLKNAFERDWTVVQAPRDVVERGTQVWSTTTADNFPAGSLNPQWTPGSSGGGTVTIGPSGGLRLTSPGGLNPSSVTSAAIAGSSVWMATANVQAYNNPSGTSTFQVTESTGDSYAVSISASAGVPSYLFGLLAINGSNMGQSALTSAVSYNLLLESDGEWVSAFINGQLVACARRSHSTTTTLQTYLELRGVSGSGTCVGVLTESLLPFLQRGGTDKGDFVLPGDATTYPAVGLHARYYNDADRQSFSTAIQLATILSPTRGQAYGASSAVPEYANRQDAQITAQANPTATGVSTSFWSVRWFGAIYLKLSAGGHYTFQWNHPGSATTNCAIRVWIGKTKFGDQQIDSWSFASGLATFAFNLNATDLQGTKSDGTVIARDGWYPIKIEYAVGNASHTAGAFFITNSPAAYTDPGGTAIASGVQATIVPSTSLSPLGCVDQRYQGISHFDLVQQTMNGYGYQGSLVPQRLESGLFPGVLAPRIREGHDTDVIVRPDTTLRTGSDGLQNYGALEDASDAVASLIGNGAGLQNGSSGQVQERVFDPSTQLVSLFDVQGWQDFSDASFAPLLHALLNSQLGLRLSPWLSVTGDPRADPRLALTWPLPGAQAAMKWRPGDGVRVRARDISLWDTSPRQLLAVTRNFVLEGITGTSVAWANRPKTPSHTLKQQFFGTTRMQRNYQKQIVTLTGNYCQAALTAGQTSNALGLPNGYSIIALGPQDTLVRLTARVTVNSAAQIFSIFVNGVDVTSTVTGGTSVTVTPINLDLTPVGSSDAFSRLFFYVKNGGGISTQIEFQLLAEVLR